MAWCGCHEILIQRFFNVLFLTRHCSIGIWDSAGVTKGVTSPAAHGGIWHGAGATKSWFNVFSMSCFWLVSVIFLSISSPLSLSAAVLQTEEFIHKMPISLGDRSESSFFQWFSRQFWAFAQTLLGMHQFQLTGYQSDWVPVGLVPIRLVPSLTGHPVGTGCQSDWVPVVTGCQSDWVPVGTGFQSDWVSVRTGCQSDWVPSPDCWILNDP